MLNSLEQFTVNLQFDDEGEIEVISYFDEKGCGWLAPHFDEEQRIGDLIACHIDHYASEHNLEPRVRCPFTANLNDYSARCDEDDEHAGPHRFTLGGG